MAKETNLNEVEVTVGNIEEVISNGRTVTPEIAKAAAEKIAAQRKEKLTNELIECTSKAEYTKKSIYLSMKKTEKDKDYKLEYLKKYTDLDNKLRSGELTIEAFEKAVREERDTCAKKISENDRKFQENKEALNEQYPNSWSWRFNNNVL